jgi:hypothetical protein
MINNENIIEQNVMACQWISKTINLKKRTFAG